MAKSRRNCKRGKKGGFTPPTMGSVKEAVPVVEEAEPVVEEAEPVKEAVPVVEEAEPVKEAVPVVEPKKGFVDNLLDSVKKTLNKVSANNASTGQSGGFKANDDFGIASDAAPVRYTQTTMPNKWVGGKRRKSRKTRKTRKTRRSRRHR